MEKLVRVIKLQPGEAVVILAEDKPAPCPCCCACMMQKDTCEDVLFPFLYLQNFIEGLSLYLSEMPEGKN